MSSAFLKLRTLSAFRPSQSESQGVQSNKPIGVALVIDIVFLESRHLGIIERRVGLASDHDDVAFIEFEPNAAAHVGLRGIDGFLQNLALGGKPITIINHL